MTDPPGSLGTLVLLGLLGLAACDRPCDEIVDEETCRKRDDCAPRSGLDMCDGNYYYGSCRERDSAYVSAAYGPDDSYLVDGRCLIFYESDVPLHGAYASCESECLDDWLAEAYPSYYSTGDD